MTNSKALTSVIAERRAQRANWGAEHDSWHSPAEWIGLEFVYLRRAAEATNDGFGHPPAFREAMVKVGALALAAIEDHDRRVDAVRGGGA